MSTPFIGEVKIVAFNFAPKGWALSNGQLLAINQKSHRHAARGAGWVLEYLRAAKACSTFS